jgi:hypothetical protein
LLVVLAAIPDDGAQTVAVNNDQENNVKERLEH